ncbi:MAG TPA: hypothetical protein VG937_32960 [Polyangiaceae bacterium]|nr:hypothetical protein [Polyangiaceae bacterium]
MAVWRALLVYLAIVAVLIAISAHRLTTVALPGVPRALWMPFARPLASAAFEMALLVAVPAAVLASRASALPLRFVMLLGAALTAATAGAAALLDPVALAPGQMAQQLIDSGRESCPSATERRVDVPIVGLTWTCPLAGPVRASGHLPSLAKARYSAGSVQVSADLREVELAALELTLPPSGERPGLRANVKRGRVRGLPPWGRPAGRPIASRLLGSVLTCFATAAMALLLLHRVRLSWFWAAAWAAVGGLVPLLVERKLDRLGNSGFPYWMASFSGALGVALLALLFVLLQRGLRRRSSVAGPSA